jgi:tape measure domain-containing protein
MAGNPIDLVVTTDALKGLTDLIARLEAADKALLNTVDSAAKLNKAVGTITTPQGLNANSSDNAQVNAQLKAQADIVAKLNTEIQELNSKLIKLNESKARGTKLTADEIVKNQELRKEAISQARANSDLIGSYQKLNIEHQKALKTAKDAAVTYGITSKEFQNASTKANQLGENLKKIDARLGQHTRNVGNYSSAWNGLGNALGSLGIMTGVAGAVALGTSIFNTTKEIQSLDNALKQVTETEANYAQQQQFLTRISESYGVELSSLTRQFTQFYVSAKDKISGTEIQKIFESITKAGATMGLSVENQNRAFLALNQMMSKGTIQAEELRGQLGEALPGAFGIMAKALNVNEQQLATMMKQGKLLASEVLPLFAEQLEKTYGIENVKKVDNLAGAQNRLTNAWKAFVKSLDEDGNKLSYFFSTALNYAANTIKGVTTLFRSEGEKRKEEMAYIQNEQYQKTLDFYSKSDELDKQDIENKRKNNSERIKENTELFNKLSERNKYLTSLQKKTIFGLYETKENQKERLANKQQMEDLNNMTSLLVGQNKAYAELTKEKIKASNTTEGTDAQRKARLKAELKAEEDRLKLLAELRKKELQAELAAIDVKLANEAQYLEERLDLLNQDFFKRSEIAKFDYSESLRLAKGNQTKEKIALIEYQNEQIKIMQDFEKKKKELNKTGFTEIGTAVESIEQEKKRREEASAGLNKITEDAQKAHTAWRFKKMEEDWEKEQALLKEKAAYMKSFVDEFASNMNLNETFSIFEGENSLFSRMQKGMAFTKETWKEDTVEMMEAFQEMFNFISNASQANFDAEYARLESQKEISIQFAGDSASAKKKIEEDFDKKKREIANREAKAKKKQAMFNIAIDTAQAVIGSLRMDPTGIMAIIIGAMGALQLGLVAAQKIPQYWKGTDHAESGLAWTNEKGAEIHTDKYGNIKSLGDNKGARLTMMEQGDKVYTASESQRMLQDKMLNDMLIDRGISMNYNSNNTSLTYAQMKEIMNETLGNKPEKNIIFDKNGFSTYIRKSGNITRYTNQRASGVGMTV